MNINKIYAEMLEDIIKTGDNYAPRGLDIIEKINYTLICSPQDNIITIPGIKTNLNYAEEELRWYLSGSNNINFSPLIKKIWSRYSDDGKTVNSAYGHRIFGTHKDFVDQWEWVKGLIEKDPDTRQAIININYSGDKYKETKDFPCTISIQILIRDNKLHWITNMRSNDAFFGFRNDLYCFTELQKRLSKELNYDTGLYYHNAGSMHIYKNNIDKIKKAIHNYKNDN